MEAGSQKKLWMWKWNIHLSDELHHINKRVSPGLRAAFLMVHFSWPTWIITTRPIDSNSWIPLSIFRCFYSKCLEFDWHSMGTRLMKLPLCPDSIDTILLRLKSRTPARIESLMICCCWWRFTKWNEVKWNVGGCEPPTFKLAMTFMANLKNLDSFCIQTFHIFTVSLRCTSFVLRRFCIDHLLPHPK